MTIQMMLPTPTLTTAYCPTLAVIDRDAGEMLARAVIADHLLIESAELGYLEAQAHSLIEAARSTCALTRAG